MATIRLFTRTITKDKNALVPIYVRIKSGRKIDLVCKTDILIKPDNWSNETQQARQRADVFRFKSGESENEKAGRQKFNDNVKELRASIESELMLTQQAELNTEWLKITVDKHWNPDKYKITLFSYIESFIKRAKTKTNRKTGRPVSYKMQREYNVTFSYLKEFAAKNGKSIDFKNIDIEFYDNFVQFLQGRNLAVNTIGKKIQTLKIFLNAAKDENQNSYEAYKSKKFEALTEDAETIYLNESELQKLYDYDFSNNPTYDHVRDLFLVGCWTGCRFSDIAQITPENVSGGFIRIKQYKTGNKVVIPLHSVVATIMNKYDGKLPESISNQKFNKYLKDIAKLAKINDRITITITKGGVKVSHTNEKHRLVTTHTARRSFATNLYKSGFPTLSIMAITGHKTERAFLRYIKVTPEEHANKLQVHWDKNLLKIV